jgi:predicted Zn-dependent protease
MKQRFWIIVALLLVCGAYAQNLPDLGDSSSSALSSIDEQRLGDNIMLDIRRDPAYLDDPEVADYVNRLGSRLTAASDSARQSFEFFVVSDPQINAFALPGGYIGLNTGLLLAAQSESEVAGVVGHEIAHVTQKHIARMVNQQSSTQLVPLAALAVAILAARSNSQVGEAAMAFGTASAVQSQLNFTRAAEQEADRVGLQLVTAAGFDPQGMANFFGRLQRATRAYDGGAPSYLRTHPLTTDRIADIENRIHNLPYRQVPDTLEFQLVRAKLRATGNSAREAIAFFEEGLREKKYLSEAAGRYGLSVAFLREKQVDRAKAQLKQLAGAEHPMIESLKCRVLEASGGGSVATDCYRTAMGRYPDSRALFYGLAESLLKTGQAAAALSFIEPRLRLQTADLRLYRMKAEAYAALGQVLPQYRALAEVHVRTGQLALAVEQLQIGLKSGKGDFYEMSAAEARLRELRKRLAEQIRRRESSN